MSEEKKELTVIEQLEADHAKYIQQRDFAQNSLNQAVGAIYANEQAIQKLKGEEAKKPYEKPTLTELTPDEAPEASTTEE